MPDYVYGFSPLIDMGNNFLPTDFFYGGSCNSGTCRGDYLLGQLDALISHSSDIVENV